MPSAEFIEPGVLESLREYSTWAILPTWEHPGAQWTRNTFVIRYAHANLAWPKYGRYCPSAGAPRSPSWPEFVPITSAFTPRPATHVPARGSTPYRPPLPVARSPARGSTPPAGPPALSGVARPRTS